MKGKEAIDDGMKRSMGQDGQTMGNIVTVTHCQLLELHSRALACHCECLGMNAENAAAAVAGRDVVYYNDSYLVVMLKWGMIDDQSKPVI